MAQPPTAGRIQLNSGIACDQGPVQSLPAHVVVQLLAFMQSNVQPPPSQSKVHWESPSQVKAQSPPSQL
jgi:hypothetical protein